MRITVDISDRKFLERRAAQLGTSLTRRCGYFVPTYLIHIQSPSIAAAFHNVHNVTTFAVYPGMASTWPHAPSQSPARSTAGFRFSVPIIKIAGSHSKEERSTRARNGYTWPVSDCSPCAHGVHSFPIFYLFTRFTPKRAGPGFTLRKPAEHLRRRRSSWATNGLPIGLHQLLAALGNAA